MTTLSRRSMLHAVVASGSTAFVASVLMGVETREAHLQRHLARRLGGPVPAQYVRRLREELTAIEERGWWPALEAMTFVAQAARRRGVFVHHSVGGWLPILTAYAGGVTRLDPVAHELRFERTLQRAQAPAPQLEVSPLVLEDLAPLVRQQEAEVTLVPDQGLDVVQRAFSLGWNVDRVDLSGTAATWRPPSLTGGDPVKNFEDLAQVLVLARLEDYAWVPARERHALLQHFFFKTEPEDPLFAAFVSRTRGLLLFQEQFVSIACDVAGFSVADAHRLRRALCIAREELVAPWRERFVAGTQRHARLAEQRAAHAFESLQRRYLLLMARSAAISEAALWCWRADAQRFLDQHG